MNHCDPAVVSVCMFVVIPRLCVNGCRRRHRLFLLLPGGQEFTHYGVLQEPRTSGLYGSETILQMYIQYIHEENL